MPPEPNAGRLLRDFKRRRLQSDQTARSRRRRGFTPAELLIASFLGLIIFGTLCLKLLPGLYTGSPLSWSDAAFTATSAVCVTGLIVVDTATYFTFAGQAVILMLIQLGGLGMLVLTSVVITALGGRPSLRTESAAVGSYHVLPQVTPRRLIVDIVRFTFFFEALGSLLLYVNWAPRLGWQEALWPSIFHAVSAFCNAGFSTNTLSLVEYQDSPATLVIISLLIIAGGLGFITIEELYYRVLPHNHLKAPRLSVHSKLVLWMTLVLTLSGWVLFALLEWNGVLAELTILDKIMNAMFMSITPRTAGFNTIDYGLASDSTNFITIILMSIGGSPGSTAGGIKTTTAALLALLAWSRLRSYSTATFGYRSIPEETIQRATGIFVIGTAIIVIGVLGLTTISELANDQQEFLPLLFETSSAFCTVGLSMNVTPTLSVPARWILIALMFAGRTGPLAIAAALVVRLSKRGKYRLAYEDVVVG